MLREDTPLDAAEAARAAAALAELPPDLRAGGAFGGQQSALDDLVARCVRGDASEHAPATLRKVLQWRRDNQIDQARRSAQTPG